MANTEPSCHRPKSYPAMNESSASINQDGSFKLMEEGSSRENVNIDARTFSDKVPLTQLHLCRYEDCHSSQQKSSSNSDSPLDPIKTRSLFTLLALIALWLALYIILKYVNVL